MSFRNRKRARTIMRELLAFRNESRRRPHASHREPGGDGSITEPSIAYLKTQCLPDQHFFPSLIHGTNEIQYLFWNNNNYKENVSHDQSLYFELLNGWIFGFLSFWIFELLNFWTFKSANFRVFNFSNFRIF